MDKISGIYRIICKANGRYYYGSSDDIQKRWKEHINSLKRNDHHNIHLQRVWNKHTEDSFRFELVELIEPVRLLEIENVYLKEHVGKSNCMNMAKDAFAPMKGKKLSDERKKEMSESRSGEKHPMYGKHHTDEAKEKNRNSHLGKRHSEETKSKMSINRSGKRNPNYGKKFSDECRRKMSEAHKGQVPWNKGIGN